MSVKHTFVSAKPPSADPTQVGSAEWNDDHTLTFGAGAGDIAEGNHGHVGVYVPVGSTDYVGSTDADWIDLTDGGATTLHTHSGVTVTIATLAVILASTPTANKVAYATTYSADDLTRVDKFLIADGTNWKIQEPAMSTINGIDMGAVQDNSRTGYGDGYITGMQIVNNTSFQIPQDATSTLNGSLRIDTVPALDELEVYLRSQWNTIIYDATYANGDFRHTPLTEQIYVWRGDSVGLGLNGRNYIQEYNSSMGAFPAPRILYGGTF